MSDEESAGEEDHGEEERGSIGEVVLTLCAGPVAYLVGAIASSAVTAVSLRADCAEFGKVVQQLEGVLVKAEGLEDQQGVVEDVRDCLAEALELMELLQQRGVLSSVLFRCAPAGAQRWGVAPGGGATDVPD